MLHFIYLFTIILTFALFLKERSSLHTTVSDLKKKSENLNASVSALATQNNSLRAENNHLLKDLANISQDIEQHYQEKQKQWQDAWVKSNEKKIRKDAIERSRSVIRGQATEHLAPLIMDDVNIKDFRFLGNPIDYLVFSGASDITDKKGKDLDKIILLEIKSGNSNLNTVQRRIRDAVKESRIEFAVYNPDTKEIKITAPEK